MTATSRNRQQQDGPATWSALTGRRLDNQIRRAIDQTYGAETGLRALVQMATREMLNAGAKPLAVREALTARVRSQPVAPAATERAAAKPAGTGETDPVEK